MKAGSIIYLSILAWSSAASHSIADTIEFPDLQGELQLSVGKSHKVNVTVIVREEKIIPPITAPVDLIFLIDDNLTAKQAIATVANDWPNFVAAVPADWNLQTGAFAYYANERPRMVRELSDDGVFETQQWYSDVWVSCEPTKVEGRSRHCPPPEEVEYDESGDGWGTKVSLYKPIFQAESDTSPARGFAAVQEALLKTPWREDSMRAVVALGNRNFKEGDRREHTSTTTIGMLGASTATFFMGFTSGDLSLANSSEPRQLAKSSGGAFWQAEQNGTLFLQQVTDAIAAKRAGVPLVEYGEVSLEATKRDAYTMDVSCQPSGPEYDCMGGAAMGGFDRGVDRAYEFVLTITPLKKGGERVKLDLMVDGETTARREFKFRAE